MSKHMKLIFVAVSVGAFLATAMVLPGLISAGSLEPDAAPGPTMKTLEEIYNRNRPIWPMLDKTFVDWAANPRFAVCDNGTDADELDDMVLDKETGLVWERKSRGSYYKDWQEAVYSGFSYSGGHRMGWRLPTIEELGSLIDKNESPALPQGHPFKFVHPENHKWSSTTYQVDNTKAYTFSMDGNIHIRLKTDTANSLEVWRVRGGSGPAITHHIPPAVP